MQDRQIILGVSGGIAAYKSADLASKLTQAGAVVSVVMTESAQEFVGSVTFEALTNRPVNDDLFTPTEHFQGEHIGLARLGELLVIAPATANCLAKLAHGMADDLLTTLALAFTGPVMVCPAMNSEMWSKASVQRNVEQLKSDGMLVVEPGEGWLSCGTVGAGRMAESMEIQTAIENVLNSTIV